MKKDKYDDKTLINMFKINQKLDVFISSKENKDMFDNYSSRIENMSEDDMTIAMPMSKGFPIILRKNEVFYGRMIISDSAYEFTSQYFDHAMKPIPVWRVSLPYNISRTQQRQDVRYDISLPVTVKICDISLPVTVKIVEAKKKEKVGQIEFLKTKDISAGGAKIISKKPYLHGMMLELIIEIPDYGEIVAAAKVLRVQKLQVDFPLYWNALQFISIKRADRDAIVQFIFKKQLEERRRMGKQQ